MKITDRKSQGRTSTGGSLAAQLVNAVPQIVGRRQANGGGGESMACATALVVAWTAADEATRSLGREALTQQLSPGGEVTVEEEAKAIARRTCMTREAARDVVVRPILEEALRDVERFRARATAGLSVEHAQAFIESIVRQTTERIDLAVAQFKAGIEPLFGAERLLAALDEAIAESGAPLATALAALEMLRSRVAAEPERIARDLDAAANEVGSDEETLRAVAVEVKGAGLFRRGAALGKMFAFVQARVPRLGAARVSLIYLPLIAAGIPAVLRALDDRIAQLRDRLEAASGALDQLHAAAVDRDHHEASSGRILAVGEPASPAARAAEVEKLVALARPGAARELRDLVAWKAPPAVLFREVLRAAGAAVDLQAPRRSIDEALFNGADPEAVAMALDDVIARTALPIGLRPDADRAFLAGVRCVVLRVAAGSRIPQVLAEHARYPLDRFDTGGTPDRLEMIVVVPGIDLAATALFAAGEAAYEDEVADRASPPVHVLSDDSLRWLVRPSNGHHDGAAIGAEQVRR